MDPDQVTPLLPVNLIDIAPQFRTNIHDPEDVLLGRRDDADNHVELPPLPQENGHFQVRDIRPAVQLLRFEALERFNRLLAFTRYQNYVKNIMYGNITWRLRLMCEHMEEERKQNEARHNELLESIQQLTENQEKILDICTNQTPRPDSNISTSLKRTLSFSSDDDESPQHKRITRSQTFES